MNLRYMGLKNNFDVIYSRGIAYVKFLGNWGIEDAIEYKRFTELLKKKENPDSTLHWIGLVDQSQLNTIEDDAMDIVTQVRKNSYEKGCLHTLYYRGDNDFSFPLFYLRSVSTNERLNGICTFENTTEGVLKKLNRLKNRYKEYEIDYDENFVRDFLYGSSLEDLL